MNKGKRIEAMDGETLLPEAMIQHIQSFLAGKEAAQTTILSKSWYNAWLTRPMIDMDEQDFCCGPCSTLVITHVDDEDCRCRSCNTLMITHAKKTMRRYRDLNLKIEHFRLLIDHSYYTYSSYYYKLIVNALKLGATNVDLDLPSHFVPPRLLGSKTLVKLSLKWCKVYGNYAISCSRLKSLSLEFVKFSSGDVFKKIILCCISMEELTLSACSGLVLSQANMYELHKLRSLFLSDMEIDTLFFSDFATRFPSLKDLALICCRGCTTLQIASTSLKSIRFRPVEESYGAKFDVPNVKKFTYSGECVPSNLWINGASREWELDTCIVSYTLNHQSWFLNLKKSLAKFRLSRISLSIEVENEQSGWRSEHEHEVYVEVVEEPLVVENLMIDAPSTLCCALLLSLFGICRPKFLTHYWLTNEWDSDWGLRNACIDILVKRLMQKLISPNCGIPNHDMFGKFGLKKVNTEVYEMVDDRKCRPLLVNKALDLSETLINNRNIQFELIWD